VRPIKSYLKKMRGGGHCPPRQPFSKIMWSWLGAFVGILVIAFLSQQQDINSGHLLLIGSFGASAVLLYGAPMAAYSQPRNLVLGNVISAGIGISLYKLIPDLLVLASALAVSLSVAAMHMTRTLHPPGGATALIAMTGSSQFAEMGYWFVIFPVLTGVLILLAIALLVNNLSGNPQRHYPVYWY
jgi:CBS-domain-containing membrane protein